MVKYLLRRNYNLASQTTSHFMDGSPNYQGFNSSPQTTNSFENGHSVRSLHHFGWKARHVPCTWLNMTQTLENVFRKNYNLAPQTASDFMDSPSNYQRLSSGPPNYQKFQKHPIYRNMPIIPVTHVIFKVNAFTQGMGRQLCCVTS